MSKLRIIIHAIRPEQWIKNVFIFVPLIFAQKFFHLPSFFTSVGTAGIFCLLASGVYIMNDFFDLEADRNHPKKKNRPLAEGTLRPVLARFLSAGLILCGLVLGYLVAPPLFLVFAGYLAIQVLYNIRLKNIPILDVFCISCGFFLRVIAGAVAIKVSVSHWLIVCTILIAMFLALAKRRHELNLLGQNDAANHRKVLKHYSSRLLDQMIGIVCGSLLLSYLLYCISPDTIQNFQTDHMIYTFPFALYGIFRYLYLVHQKEQGGSPEMVLMTDPPLLICVFLWGVFCLLIINGIV